MNKFTEILLNEKWAGKMIEDFNGSNQDLKDIEVENLKEAKKNIVNIIASLDDLKRSINEEIKDREKDKDKEVIEGYLNSFTTENNPIQVVTNRFANREENKLVLEEIRKKIENQIDEEVSEDINKGTFAKKQETQRNLRQEYVAKGTNEFRENIQRKEEPKVEVPEKIQKAIEIAKKYKVGVSFIENGDIAKMIQNGQVSVEDAMVPIINLYFYLIETKTASKEDKKYIIETVNKELKIEEKLKSFLSDILISKLV